VVVGFAIALPTLHYYITEAWGTADPDGNNTSTGGSVTVFEQD